MLFTWVKIYPGCYTGVAHVGGGLWLWAVIFLRGFLDFIVLLFAGDATDYPSVVSIIKCGSAM